MHRFQFLTFTILSISTLLFINCIDAQETKGLYVNDFKHIIGDKAEEHALLELAKSQGFNYLLLYNLHYVHRNNFAITNRHSAKPLADFIHLAKTEYGIERVGAVGETRKSFDRIDQYNELYGNDSSRKIDVYNIELEFWNKKLIKSYYCEAYLAKKGLECNTDGAFEFYISQLKSIHKLAKKRGVNSETYVGHPTAKQSQIIGASTDRVLLHYYRKSATYNNGNSICNYQLDRLEAFAPKKGQVTLIPIFHAGPDFMGPWLADHSLAKAHEIFLNGTNGFTSIDQPWKDHIHIDGYQWYRSSDLMAVVKNKKEGRKTTFSFMNYVKSLFGY